MSSFASVKQERAKAGLDVHFSMFGAELRIPLTVETAALEVEVSKPGAGSFLISERSANIPVGEIPKLPRETGRMELVSLGPFHRREVVFQAGGGSEILDVNVRPGVLGSNASHIQIEEKAVLVEAVLQKGTHVRTTIRAGSRVDGRFLIR